MLDESTRAALAARYAPTLADLNLVREVGKAASKAAPAGPKRKDGGNKTKPSPASTAQIEALKTAIKSAKTPEDRAAAIRRARILKRMDLIPENWLTPGPKANGNPFAKGK